MSTSITLAIKLQEDVRWNKLNSGILVMERHFLQYRRKGHGFHYQIYWLINRLTDYNLKRTKLINIIEHTNITEENWVEFNQNLEEIENTILNIINTENFTQSILANIKNNFWLMDAFVKMRLKMCRGYLNHKDIVFNQITDEELKLDLDLNDPKNYEFRMYLKNSPESTKFKKILIKQFNLKDIKLERDIFGEGREEFAKRVLRKKGFIVAENVNNNSSIIKVSNTVIIGEARSSLVIPEHSHMINKQENIVDNNSSLRIIDSPSLDIQIHRKERVASNAKTYELLKDGVLRRITELSLKENINNIDSNEAPYRTTRKAKINSFAQNENIILNDNIILNNIIFNKIVDPPPNTIVTS